ncbi:MAG: hypothetical protein P8Y39_12840 [Nitrospirota bacterium]|jgi:hypothetical protein
MKQKNCWEVMHCQREQGGKMAGASPCPASTEARLNGVHGGRNGGRACWSVAGTMCGEEACCVFVRLYSDCGKCKFYLSVRQEEADFKFALSLLNMRRNCTLAKA